MPDESVDAGARRPRIEIAVHVRADAPVRVRLAGDRVTIGRSPDCGLVVPDDTLSRVHAELVRGPSGFELRDCGSRNGTSVNGVPPAPWPGARAHRGRGAPAGARPRSCSTSTTGPRPRPAGVRRADHGRVGFARRARPGAARRFGGDARGARRDRARRAHRKTVLFTGESGTGKELVARLLHRARRARAARSSRSTARRIPATLLEAELFGVERGAFTGAEARAGPLRARRRRHALPRRDRRPAARRAGEAPARPPGARDRAHRRRGRDHVDVRVVAATNHDLAADGRPRRVPPRPLLPAERLSDPSAAAPRAARRHPAPGRALPRRDGRGGTAPGGRRPRAPRPRLPGERARARAPPGERARRRRRRHDARRSASCAPSRHPGPGRPRGGRWPEAAPSAGGARRTLDGNEPAPRVARPRPMAGTRRLSQRAPRAHGRGRRIVSGRSCTDRISAGESPREAARALVRRALNAGGGTLPRDGAAPPQCPPRSRSWSTSSITARSQGAEVAQPFSWSPDWWMLPASWLATRTHVPRTGSPSLPIADA